MVESSFIHLRAHSFYSLGKALPSIEQLVAAAVEHGMPALALTDENSLAGALDFTHQCLEKEIQPIIGCDLSVQPYQNSNQKIQTPYKITLLIENERGYRNLTRLVSLANRVQFNEQPAGVHFQDLKENTEGLICLVGGISSELFEFFAQRDVDGTVQYLNTIADVFGGEQIFFELQNHDDPKVKKLNTRSIELAEFLGIPLVATQDIRYLDPEGELVYMFMQGKPAPQMLNVHRWLDRTNHHFASPVVMKGKFGLKPRALDSTRQIAKRCNFILSYTKKKGPTPDFERGSDADSFLWNLAFERAAEYFDDLTDEIKDRLNQEFELIKDAGLSTYILLLWQIAKYLDEQRITRGIGQGHLVTSLIAHVLGLTKINPSQHNLKFNASYLTDETSPLLAIEVSANHVQEVLDYVRKEYGEDNICYAGEYTLWDRKNLLQQLIEWSGVGERRAKAILLEESKLRGERLDKKWDDLFKNGAANLSVQDPEVIFFIFAALHKAPSSLKVHLDELFISSENLDSIIPRVWKEEHVGISQISARACLDLGLPRIHVLTNPSLEILDLACEWVRREKNERFDINEIPMDDERTYTMFHEGRTVGIQTLDTPTMKALLRMFYPKDLRGLIKIKSMDPTPRALMKTSFEPMADIPNCLLAYRCAFIKANYPASFYTALLSLSYRNPKLMQAALHELRSLNIQLLPVDVHISDFDFTQNGNRIQVGLKLINRMGEKAATEILKKRKGGNFMGLVDFCRSTESRAINQALITNLIKSGALDGFRLHRSQLMEMLPHALKMGRPGGSHSEDDGTPNLFEIPRDELGLDEENIIPDIQEWPAAEIIKQERQALGLSLSRSPLQPYLNLLQTSQANYPPAINIKMLHQEVYFAGIIDNITHEFPAIDDNAEALADVEGEMILLSQRFLEPAKHAIEKQIPVLCGGRVLQKNDVPFLKIHCLYEMPMIEERIGTIKRLQLNLEGENRRTLLNIWAVLQRFPGQSEIEVVNYSGRAGGWTLSKLRNHKILFTPPLYFELGKILPRDRITLYDQNNEPQPYQYVPMTKAAVEKSK